MNSRQFYDYLQLELLFYHSRDFSYVSSPNRWRQLAARQTRGSSWFVAHDTPYIEQFAPRKYVAIHRPK